MIVGLICLVTAVLIILRRRKGAKKNAEYFPDYGAVDSDYLYTKPTMYINKADLNKISKDYQSRLQELVWARRDG